MTTRLPCVCLIPLLALLGCGGTDDASSSDTPTADTLTADVPDTATPDTRVADSSVTDDAADAQPDADAAPLTPIEGVRVAPLEPFNDAQVTCVTPTSLPAEGATIAWRNVSRGEHIGAGVTVTLNAALAAPGELIRCTATSTTSSGSGETTVANRSPVVSNVTLSPPAPAPDDVVTCAGDITDADGETPSEAVSWTVGGAAAGTAATIDLGAAGASFGDTVACTLTAEDGLGDVGSADASVVLSSGLSVVDAQISPPTVYNDVTVTCDASLSPEGAGGTLSYRWTNLGADTTLGTGSDVTLTPATAAPGDVVRCTIEGERDGEIADASVSVTVTNRAPTIDAVTITPPMPYDDDEVTCSAATADPDAGAPAVSYAWSNTTSGAALGVGATLALSPSDVEDEDIIACIATADDGLATASALATASIRQRPMAGDVRSDSELGEVVYIPSGTSELGCKSGRDDVDVACTGLGSYTVELTRSFWAMRAEVTQGQYAVLMGDNPSQFGPSHGVACGPGCPVERVTWFDAVAFADAVSDAQGLTPCGADADPYGCEGWRLPTAAEWEVAARGGEEFRFAGSDDPDGVAWYSGNTPTMTTSTMAPWHCDQRACTRPGCGKAVNGFGLCDLSGNVYEWVQDAHFNWPGGEHFVDPIHTAPSEALVVGGAFHAQSTDLLVYRRQSLDKDDGDAALGFRLVRTAP